MARTLEDLLRDRDVVILDGAVGTELERRGVPLPLPVWTGDAAGRAPDVLRGIYLDYLRAGVDVVTACTWRTQPYVLRTVGREAEAAALTRQSVAIARAACVTTGHGLVAGSMGPLEDCYHPERVPAADVLRREHAVHAELVAEAGVDLIMLETMNTSREAHAAAEAALATGLPVLVSLILDPVRGDVLSGEDLETVSAHLRTLEVEGRLLAGFLVNCAPPATITSALARLDAPRDPRPIGAYANLGLDDGKGGWRPDTRTPPEAYGERAREWRALGARLIGGCCGSTPEHLAAVSRALRAG